MATFLLRTSPSLLFPNPTTTTSGSRHPLRLHPISKSLKPSSSISTPKSLTRLRSTPSDSVPEPDSESESIVPDEWGEKAEPEPETAYTKFTDPDPAQNDDEWGGGGGGERGDAGNETGSAADVEDGRVGDLKRALVDTVYGTNLGFGASVEVRAEALELVNQLEAANPTPAPVEAEELLGGNWVLVYTAFSELLPLLALGTVPFLKVEKIRQDIDIPSQTIVNSIVVSSPFASFSFSASASFEVRSPTRIQVTVAEEVEFKEGTLKPPEVTPNITFPENIDIFGQRIDLSPLQQSINPIQDVVATISRTISGQAPLKLPIPGNNSQSWLITTFLDEDLRIGRGDGGLFVLAREGSPLLDQ